MTEELRRPPSRRRRLVRFARRCFLLGLLAIVAGVFYVNQIGLPGFVKDRLLREMAARGVQVDFSRLRWRWPEGIVAENLVLKGDQGDTGPVFESTAASISLELERWFGPQFRIDSVALRDGRFAWLLPGTNGLVPLQLDGIHAEVALTPGQVVNLRQFSSRFQNVKLNVSGTFTNAAALARGPRTNAAPPNLALLNETLVRVANYLTNFQFGAEPELNLRFHADAADWSTLRADLALEFPRVETTWGTGEGFRLNAQVRPASATNAESLCAITLSGAALDTPWGRLERWRADTLTVPVVQLPQHSSNTVNAAFARLTTRWGVVEDGRVQIGIRAADPARATELAHHLVLEGKRFVTTFGSADQVTLRSEGSLDRTTGAPVTGSHWLTARELIATNFNAGMVQARITQLPAPSTPPPVDDSWGFWRMLAPYAFQFDVAAEGLSVQTLPVEAVQLAGVWSAPRFELAELRAKLFGGRAQLRAEVDVPGRQIEAAADVAFDFHRLDPLFTERFRRWFAPYQWRGTPEATVTGRLQWPDWRNLKPDWREEVVPSVGMSGKFRVAGASYKGIPGDQAFSDFHFTNFVWHLPNLTIVRPEGRTVATYDGDERTRDYRWQIRAEVDPHALKPLFEDRELKVFDSFTNHATPRVEGTIWGRWRAPERVGVTASLTAPRLELRGENTDLITANLEYTNRFLTIRNLEIQQSNRVGRAAALGLDLPGNRLYFTNVESTLPPQSVARAIGPLTARTVAPYQFVEAPRIRLNGTLGLTNHDATDLRFTVGGGPFHWWRLKLEEIEADLWWRSNRLDLTNVVSRFYGGEADGAAAFQFFPDDRPGEFSFGLSLTNSQLKGLTHDLFVKTNGLEGALSGELTVTSARTDSLDTWQGTGTLHLRDGVVWDLPIFGIFSPIFNAISPGLGSSRADQAAATFTIINGTVISRDLQVRSAEFSMGYQGSVDFMGNVDARMQARILKDSGILGPLISTALWPLTKIFEYRMMGTLAEPVAEPVHIPRFLFMALEPFKALQGALKGVGNVVTKPPEPAAPEP